MLFAMSLHMLWLGLLLAFIMIFGMAATISAVVIAGVTGKICSWVHSSKK